MTQRETRTVGRFFCGRIVPGQVRSIVVQVDCPICGWYEVTLGAIEHLRTNEQLKVAARVEICRERDSGTGEWRGRRSTSGWSGNSEGTDARRSASLRALLFRRDEARPLFSFTPPALTRCRGSTIGRYTYRSDEALTQVSPTRTAACLFCDKRVPLRLLTGMVQLDCSDCGWYEVTTGAIDHLRVNAHLKVAALAEIRRQHAEGVGRAQINFDTVRELEGR
jgi:hypothetical protein